MTAALFTLSLWWLAIAFLDFRSSMVNVYFLFEVPLLFSCFLEFFSLFMHQSVVYDMNPLQLPHLGANISHWITWQCSFESLPSECSSCMFDWGLFRFYVDHDVSLFFFYRQSLIRFSESKYDVDHRSRTNYCTFSCLVQFSRWFDLDFHDLTFYYVDFDFLYAPFFDIPLLPSCHSRKQ